MVEGGWGGGGRLFAKCCKILGKREIGKLGGLQIKCI